MLANRKIDWAFTSPDHRRAGAWGRGTSFAVAMVQLAGASLNCSTNRNNAPVNSTWSPCLFASAPGAHARRVGVSNPEFRAKCSRIKFDAGCYWRLVRQCWFGLDSRPNSSTGGQAASGTHRIISTACALKTPESESSPRPSWQTDGRRFRPASSSRSSRRRDAAPGLPRSTSRTRAPSAGASRRGRSPG